MLPSPNSGMENAHEMSRDSAGLLGLTAYTSISVCRDGFTRRVRNAWQDFKSTMPSEEVETNVFGFSLLYQL